MVRKTFTCAAVMAVTAGLSMRAPYAQDTGRGAALFADTCASCHGDVWAEDVVKPQLPMKMKACVDCHKTNHATVVCTACHELTQ